MTSPFFFFEVINRSRNITFLTNSEIIEHLGQHAVWRAVLKTCYIYNTFKKKSKNMYLFGLTIIVFSL